MNQAAYTMTGSQDEARRRFVDFVKIHAIDDKFIRREEEKRILQEGMMRFNLSLEEARGQLLSLANENGYVLQRDTEEQIGELLNVFAAKNKRRKVAETEFRQAVEMYRIKAKGRLPEQEVRQRVKVLMQHQNLEPKRSGWLIRSRKWFNSIQT